MATTNTCKALQKSVGWCEGAVELPGIRKQIFFTAYSNIVKMPTLDTDDNGRPTDVTLKGAVELASDSKFHCIDGIANKNQYTSEPQGEIPSQTQLNKLVVVYPSLGPEATALCAWLNNTPSVVIFQDNAGRWRIMRNAYGAFKATVNQDSGQGITGELSTTINIEDVDIVSAPFLPAGFTFETDGGTVSIDALSNGL